MAQQPPFMAYRSSRVPAYTTGAPGLAASSVRAVAQPVSCNASKTSSSLFIAAQMMLTPTREHVLGNVQQIENPRHHKVHQVIDRLRLVIEAGRRGQDGHTHVDNLSMCSR